MKSPFLLIIAFFAVAFLTTSCGKDADEPEPETVIGVYDLISYSLTNCGGVAVNLNTETEECSTIVDTEFCLGGTLEVTDVLLKLDLKISVDGEEDGMQSEVTYTITGNQITTCEEPNDCETNQFEFTNGIVKITYTDTADGCMTTITARKR